MPKFSKAKFFAAALFILFGLSAALAAADGVYSIGEDSRGVYLQTDRGSSWYISSEDLAYFQVGEKGRYILGSDSAGTYLRIEDRPRFYVGNMPETRVEKEIQDFNQRQKQRPQNKKSVGVIVNGNQVLVPVTLKHGYKSVETKLLLDTGASITVIHQKIAGELSLKPMRTGQAILAGGKTVPLALAQVNQLSVGNIHLKNLPVGIIDYQAASAAHQGLLGMDFLKSHPYRIDYERQTIEWGE